MASQSLSRAAGGVSAAVAVSRVLGLVREVVFATLFGAGRELDAFIAAFRIPNLLRDLFAEGALSAAFVSTFSRKLEREGDEAAWQLASRVITDLLLVVGTLVLLGIAAAPWIVEGIAPGFRADPGKVELTILLTRILFPFLLVVALAAVVMGILNSRSIFFVPASASSFFNLGSIVGGLLCVQLLAPHYLASVWGSLQGEAATAADETVPALVGMTIGTLGGGLLQLLVQLPSLHGTGFRYRMVAGFRDEGVQQVMRLMGPATIGIAAVQINVLVNTAFASGLGDGAVSWLNVAFRLMYLPIGMFGVAIGTVALPAMARASARKDQEALRRSLGEGLGLLLVLCVPAAVGLAVLSQPIIGLIYEHGRFTASDTEASAIALAAYAVGLSGYASIKVLGPAFYALDDAQTPMRVSLLSVAINLVLNWTAVRILDLGHGGLALSTSLVALWNSALLYRLLKRRIGGPFPELRRTLGRTLVASTAMAVVCVLTARSLAGIAEGTLRYFVIVAVTVPLGGLAYVVVGDAIGIRELGMLLARLRSR